MLIARETARAAQRIAFEVVEIGDNGPRAIEMPERLAA